MNSQGKFTVKIKIASGHEIVLIDVAGNKDIPVDDHNSNIYCIDQNGNVLWQVQAEGTIYDRDSFVSIEIAANGTIYARRFFGNEFEICPKTGIGKHIGWSK